MFRFLPVLLIIALSFFLFGCNSSSPLISDEAAYLEDIQQWQQQRLERLKSKNGWLNLAGLFWLSEGENSFGSDISNDIQFPEKAAAFCGSLVLDSGKVTLNVFEGIEISVHDSLLKVMVLADDHQPNTTRLQQGELAWYILKRGDRYGIRLRDHKHPRIDQLDQIPSYPVQTDYVVEATLDPFDSVKIMTVATPLDGFTEEYQCPGILNFTIKGKEQSLHPFISGNGYFLVIADETTGLDTYGAGRFMYASPDSSGQVILDFNRAYNPPCAFSPFATCPMPPRENFLTVAIEAGEKSVHFE
jgi:uncharacterized protein